MSSAEITLRRVRALVEGRRTAAVGRLPTPHVLRDSAGGIISKLEHVKNALALPLAMRGLMNA